jgi:uncharacterized protein YmfQ (DUF2313 family)
MAFLPTRTDDEQTRVTADFLPGGSPFEAKRITSKNVFKFLRGLSKSITRYEAKQNEIVDGRNLINSTTFLERWEGAVGIPDNAFPGTAVIDDRQSHAIVKLAAEGVHLGESDEFQSIQWLFAFMGLVVRVYAGHEFWPNGTDPRVTFATEKEARFTTVVELDLDQSDSGSIPTLFPVPFPWPFLSSNWNVAQEFLPTILPANVNAKWIIKTDIYKDTIGASDVYKDTIGAADVYKDRIGGV